ncbi:MAG: hypothetical protein Q9222_002164 [Ikaeria aurantiellina]
MSAPRNTHHVHPSTQSFDALHINGYHTHRATSRTPNRLPTPLPSIHSAATTDVDLGADEDPKVSIFAELFLRSEARLEALFDAENNGGALQSSAHPAEPEVEEHDKPLEDAPRDVPAPFKKPARAIDEDDYDDSDAEDDDVPVNVSPLKAKSTGPTAIPALSSAPMARDLSLTSSKVNSKPTAPSGINRSSEDARKELEQDKKATEDAAKRSFHTLFYTVENDRDAMFDQKKLEESERQVDAEMSRHNNSGHPLDKIAAGNGQQGTLSQTNLGASSLTLKHLIARIDMKRNKVIASDAELRNLMSEVRKNRSKWASEDRVGQEELYEAAEKVLSELKAMTEHSTAFLQRVNKRDAPDYYNVIKHPMDLGTMTKKLKAVQYKSKQEFVTDINLIWSNCLSYNANPEHFLRRHALFMRKETEKLVPLIPAIVIRDRAEVEAEERRQHQAEADIEGGEESDDEPIISSRGRKAPGKKAKKGSTAPRKAPAGNSDENHSGDTKPSSQHLAPTGLGAKLKNESLRAESEAATERSATDPTTPPPPRSITPSGVNGILGHDAAFTDADPLDVDGAEAFVDGAAALPDSQPEVEYEDAGYKTWKQVTKKDRALVTAERHRLFKGNEINEDEPALLRRKAGMRSWLRKQKQAVLEGAAGHKKAEVEAKEPEEAAPSGETLAEGIEGEEERVLPDYYDTLSAIPDLPSRLQWVENTPGEVEDACEDYLRILPKGLFTSPESPLAKKIEENMRQLQATRKICSKIAVVKQMQIQSQMYHGQFQKVDPAPLVEQDIDAHVMNDEGPVVNTEVSKAALKRSVAKLFFHAGFEEFQPSALDAVTDLASDFFMKITKTLVEYSQTPKIPVAKSVPGGADKAEEVMWKDRFTQEEMILHTLHENGSDLEALESYVKDETDRSGTKLVQMQDRMKAHLADLLRPALTDAGPDGSNAFNDGSDQFVSGDFADDFGEDFFGFRELGLDKELGLASMAVPLHLLQNRMHSAHQSQNPSNMSSNLPSALPPPAPLPPITVDNIDNQIGLVQQFFRAKLQANNNKALVEDDDLPQKQRFPKPRLPPTGKISSPRKRPIREPGPGKGHPRKKMKLNNDSNKPETEISRSPVGKLKLGVPTTTTTAPATENGDMMDTGKDGQPASPVKDKAKGKEGGKENLGGSNGGMISPESLEAT